MKQDRAIHWFRQDLRLSDNPALTRAAQSGQVIPVYILDDQDAQDHAMGAASRCWLHQSLLSLNDALKGQLCLYRGCPIEVLTDLVARLDMTTVTWTRCYEPWRMERDARLKQDLKSRGVLVQSFNGSLLWEPWQIHKADGTPYKVFTHFYRKGCLSAAPPRLPLPVPDRVQYITDPKASRNPGFLELLPKFSWDKKLYKIWDVGEPSAQSQFQSFMTHGLARYKEGRDYPASATISRLSPHLHFGEISPNQLWHTVRHKETDTNVDHFCSELGWREFSYNLLFHNPDLPHKNLQSKFDPFPWVNDTKALTAWQTGQTGIPMVDAGMRELWQTGYMHNRVRMIVGSFLVKNLRVHWRQGEHWFWDTLLDADLANNSASWQWVAGCGADAAPYFRIFNPVTQGQKFDPDGVYIRQYIPEISTLPNKYLFSPWTAPDPVLRDARITLGTTYPYPVVDLKQSREAALEAFQSLKVSMARSG